MFGSLYVTRIQRFSTHDGPGVRTTVFLQGCGMRCAWCHNPETQPAYPPLCRVALNCIRCGACVAVCPTGACRDIDRSSGFNRSLCIACGRCAKVCPTGACALAAKRMSPEDIVADVLRDRAFYGRDGGVTVSGGEPLFQSASLELLGLCREAGLHTAMETAGYVSSERMRRAARMCNLILYDLKDTDPARHRLMTGVEHGRIRDNLMLCDQETEGTVRLRCIMVRGVNMTAEHYAGIADIYCRLTRCEGVELIPYHAFAGGKATEIGLPDNAHSEWIPSPEDMGNARTALMRRGVTVLG